MSVQAQLDPLSRNLLATIGRALMALATGDLDLPTDLRVAAISSDFDRLRGRLHEGDGRRTRNFVPRKQYAVKPTMATTAVNKLTPAGQRLVKALRSQPQQTAPQLVAATGLKRKTVENILSVLNGMKALVVEDVLSSDA